MGPVQVAQVHYIQQPIQQQQPQYNPNANVPIQPGVFVANQQPQQQQVVQSENKMDDGVDYGNEIKEKSKAAAKVAGKQAKKAGVAALGWMAKKMNDLNEKLQDDKNQEGQEGNKQNKATY